MLQKYLSSKQKILQLIIWKETGLKGSVNFFWGVTLLMDLIIQSACRWAIINLHPSEYIQGFHYYPFVV